MLKIRHVSIILLILFSSAVSADLQMSIGIGFPNVNIGINVPAYPEFVIVPGYPVYYAPRMEANFFFYDGLYWVYQDDNWYESSWYNGPWWLVDPDDVPLYVLRVPVRYYRMPPAYFIGWQFDAPPRWGDHWGRDWHQRRNGWDRWDHRSTPSPAPLPAYQRNYSGDKYPKQIEHQKELRQQNYGFQSRDPGVRKQNEHPQNSREQNFEQKTPRTDFLQEKPKQDIQEINRNNDSQQIEKKRNDSSHQVIPPQKVMSPQQDRSGNHDQQSPRNEGINNQKSAPNAPPSKDLSVKDPNQRQEQRAVQPQEQQQPNKQNLKQKNQNDNPERQQRQEQGQDRGKSRND